MVCWFGPAKFRPFLLKLPSEGHAIIRVDAAKCFPLKRVNKILRQTQEDFVTLTA
jgi:hypothetical protein